MKWAVKPVKKPSGALKELLPCLNKNFSPQTPLLRQAKNGDLATSEPFLHIIHSLKIFSVRDDALVFEKLENVYLVAVSIQLQVLWQQS